MDLDATDGSQLHQTPFDLNFDGIFDKNDLVLSSGTGGPNTAGTPGYVPISGVKSKVGIPSAPAIIEARSGLTDYVGINNTSGGTGIGVPDGVTPAVSPGQMPAASQGVDQGRTMWNQVK